MRKPKANNIGKSPIKLSNEERARKQKEIRQEQDKKRKKLYLGIAIKLSLCGVAVYYILKKIKK